MNYLHLGISKVSGDLGQLLKEELICSFLKFGLGELHLHWTSYVCGHLFPVFGGSKPSL